jgi:hypothetical protein
MYRAYELFDMGDGMIPAPFEAIRKFKVVSEINANVNVESTGSLFLTRRMRPTE